MDEDASPELYNILHRACPPDNQTHLLPPPALQLDLKHAPAKATQQAKAETNTHGWQLKRSVLFGQREIHHPSHPSSTNRKENTLVSPLDCSHYNKWPTGPPQLLSLQPSRRAESIPARLHQYLPAWPLDIQKAKQKSSPNGWNRHQKRKPATFSGLHPNESPPAMVAPDLEIPGKIATGAQPISRPADRSLPLLHSLIHPGTNKIVPVTINKV